MNKFLAFITFLLFLLLLWFANDNYQTCCNKNNNVIEKAPSKTLSNTDSTTTSSATEKATNDNTNVEKKQAKSLDALTYKWNSNEAITSDAWEKEKTTILSGKQNGKILQIVAPYFKDEGKKLAIERAKNVFAKLGGKDVLSNTEFKSKLLKYYDGAKTSPFDGTDFNWLVRNKNIKEMGNKVIIYFPSGSSKKISNENIINYLNSVATNLKTNDKKVILSGHSDNSGNAINNDHLALARAKSIKAELVKLGVDANRITTISYGEARPIATNATRAGRQKNRRVELEIK